MTVWWVCSNKWLGGAVNTAWNDSGALTSVTLRPSEADTQPNATASQCNPRPLRLNDAAFESSATATMDATLGMASERAKHPWLAQTTRET